MGRPKLIRTEDGGEISLKNCKTETVLAVSDAIANIGKEPAAKVEAKPASPAVSLDSTAFGLYYKDGKWIVTTIKYDFETGAAEVTNIEPSFNKEEAHERFKINVAKTLF